MLTTIELTLSVGDRKLVTALDWHVEAGECWVIIGPNGAGKSTLLHTLAGIRSVEQGVVHLRGRDLIKWGAQEMARERAYLPQGRSDAFGYTVMETVLTARHPHQNAQYWETESDHRLAYAALERLDVQHLAHRDIRTLSGGERQRVAIASVLAQDTPLLLLDEPANALDLAHQVGVMRLLARLCREAGKTVILVSHDLNLAHSVASHALLLMGNGEWHAGTAPEVMRADLLGRCLGHPISAIQHGKRTIYIPAEEEHNER